MQFEEDAANAPDVTRLEPAQVWEGGLNKWVMEMWTELKVGFGEMVVERVVGLVAGVLLEGS